MNTDLVVKKIAKESKLVHYDERVELYKITLENDEGSNYRLRFTVSRTYCILGGVCN